MYGWGEEYVEYAPARRGQPSSRIARGRFASTLSNRGQDFHLDRRSHDLVSTTPNGIVYVVVSR
jgi:hypothetical protein